MRRFWIIWISVSLPVWCAAQFPDDLPGGPDAATLLTGNSNEVTGVIEIDIDQDWFRFESHPDSSVHLQFDTNTLWDLAVEILAPDQQISLAQTNTAALGTAQWGWTNTGPYGTFYLGLSGHLEFTTGSYQVVVTQAGFEDSDFDGLNDAWETNHFGNLSRDGSLDLDRDRHSDATEYLTGTQPTNSSSVIQVVAIERIGETDRVYFPSQPFGTYQLKWAEELSGSNWMSGDTLLNTNGVSLLSLDHTRPAGFSLYRIDSIH